MGRWDPALGPAAALGFSQGEMVGLEEWSNSTDILVLCTSDSSE